MDQRIFHWTNFKEILYLGMFSKICLGNFFFQTSYFVPSEIFLALSSPSHVTNITNISLSLTTFTTLSPPCESSTVRFFQSCGPFNRARFRIRCVFEGKLIFTGTLVKIPTVNMEIHRQNHRLFLTQCVNSL